MTFHRMKTQMLNAIIKFKFCCTYLFIYTHFTIMNRISFRFMLVVLKRTDCWMVGEINNLTSKSVEGTSLPLEGIDNIHGCDSLPLGVFSVGDSISDDILKENLKNSTSLLIDQTRDTLDSSTTSQPSDSGFGDTLDVVSQHLPVTLSASLSKSLSSFATSSHVAVVSVNDGLCWVYTGLYGMYRPIRKC